MRPRAVWNCSSPAKICAKSGCAFTRPARSRCRMKAGQEMLLAEVLSPSQVSQFLNCPAKWMFRYLLDLKEPGTAATALGRAFHETIAHNFRQKAETANDLPVAE